MNCWYQWRNQNFAEMLRKDHFTLRSLAVTATDGMRLRKVATFDSSSTDAVLYLHSKLMLKMKRLDALLVFMAESNVIITPSYHCYRNFEMLRKDCLRPQYFVAATTDVMRLQKAETLGAPLRMRYVSYQYCIQLLVFL
ncbi:hypothetical protein KSS87_018508 [Heliosperma pusillum]|nr:hypothetical protein KSS87_018508 [Heliosperma pusillum]